jgi:MFS family permease
MFQVDSRDGGEVRVAATILVKDDEQVSEIGVRGAVEPEAAVPAGKRRLYYGWYVVGVCNVVAVMTWGIGVFNQGVFLRYFVDSFGWDRAALSFGPMLFYIWAGVAGLLVGRLIDRVGPRPILIFGAIILGAGTTALGFAREPWHVYPGFFLLGTGYACLHTVTLGAIISRWFARQRARAMGAATFGASFGGMILAPLNAVLLEGWGGPVAGLTLAAIAISLVVPLTLLIVKDGPEAVGQQIDGGARSEDRGASGKRSSLNPRSSTLADERDWRVGEAARTVAFWAIAV